MLREKRKAYNVARREEKKAYDKAYRKAHRKERNEEKKAYRKAHLEERKTYDRAYNVARLYNVSLRDAKMLIALRDGEGAWCDICRVSEGPFHIDHDHTTRKIRGILCIPCNRRIEAVENGFPIRAALEYLKEYGSV